MVVDIFLDDFFGFVLDFLFFLFYYFYFVEDFSLFQEFLKGSVLKFFAFFRVALLLLFLLLLLLLLLLSEGLFELDGGNEGLV